MSNDIDEYQHGTMGTVTGRFSKSDKLEMYKRMYNVTNDRRDPEKPRGLLIDELDEALLTVAADYSSVDDRMAAFWLDLETRRIPVTADDFKSISYTVAYDGKSSRAGRNNLHFNKAVAKRRKANKAARKARRK
jgi:hypothetical protein